MLLELDTSTTHCKNELSLMRTDDALELPPNSTDTQPPPATALRDEAFCEDSVDTTATALFSISAQPVTVTFRISNAAIAPPHVEHGSFDLMPVGHPIRPPIAELRLKLLFRAVKNNPLTVPVTEIAPPLAALQLLKLQRDTVTLLSTADTAPPFPSALEQC